MIDLDLLKSELGIELTDESQDDLLERLEAAAVAYMSSQTGVYFGDPLERIEHISGNHAREIWLANPPTEDEAITVETEGDFNVWTELDAADYAVRGSALLRRSCWPRGIQNIRVTYTAGMDGDSAPEDVRDAVIDIVKSTFAAATGEAGVKAEAIGGYSWTADDSSASMVFGPTTEATIAAYKRPVMA